MPLIDKILLIPVFLHIALFTIVAVKMYRARVAAVTNGEVTIADIALDKSLWPDNVKKLQNNLSNQFETPPLFIAAIILALVLGLNSWLFVAISFVFIISRFVHYRIHTGSNHIPSRVRSFMVCLFAMLAQWLYLFIYVMIA